METTPAHVASAYAPRTAIEAGRDLAWEAEGIAEARADVTADRMVDAADVRAWVDSLQTNAPLPPPLSRN